MAKDYVAVGDMYRQRTTNEICIVTKLQVWHVTVKTQDGLRDIPVDVLAAEYVYDGVQHEHHNRGLVVTPGYDGLVVDTTSTDSFRCSGSFPRS